MFILILYLFIYLQNNVPGIRVGKANEVKNTVDVVPTTNLTDKKEKKGCC